MSVPVVASARVERVKQVGQFVVKGTYKSPGGTHTDHEWVVLALAIVDGNARYLCVESTRDISNPFLAYADRFSRVEGETVCEPLEKPIEIDLDGFYFFPKRSPQYRTVEFVPQVARFEALAVDGAIPVSESLTDSVEVSRIKAQ